MSACIYCNKKFATKVLKKKHHIIVCHVLINQVWNPEQHNDSIINDSFYWYLLYWVRNFVPVETNWWKIILRLYVNILYGLHKVHLHIKYVLSAETLRTSCLSVEFDNECLESWGSNTIITCTCNVEFNVGCKKNIIKQLL